MRNVLIRLAAIALGLVTGFAPRAAAQAWSPAAAPLMTRWAAGVSPTNAHREYPRPQLVREAWRNLNGLWDYAITPQDAPAPESFAGKILVPFPVESALSGVMQPLPEDSTLWYRRTFTVPPAWRGRKVLLHFGAVDWEARVEINGRLAGVHRGGYDAFGLDISDHLRWQGRETVVVAVRDSTGGGQPRGKQSLRPQGVFYSSVSGIWQTVWLEPVPNEGIDRLKLKTDIARGEVKVEIESTGSAKNRSLEVHVTAGGEVSVGREVRRGHRCPWS